MSSLTALLLGVTAVYALAVAVVAAALASQPFPHITDRYE